MVHEEFRYWDFDISHIVLASFYIILAICTIISFAGTKGYSNYFSISFHTLLILGAIFRATLFIIFPLAVEDIIRVNEKLLDVFNTLPTFFFFTVYSVVSILGTLIQEENLPTTSQTDLKKMISTIFYGNLAMYGVVIILYIFDFTIDPPSEYSVNLPTTVTGIVIQLFAAFMYFFGSILFVFILYNHYIKNYKEIIAANKSNEYATVRKMFAIIFPFSFFSFMVRAVLTAVTTFVSIASWYKDILYYTFLEILPVSFLLLIVCQRASLRLLREKFSDPEREPMISNSKEYII